MLLPRPIQRVATGRRVGHVERHLGHVTPPRSGSVKHLTNVDKEIIDLFFQGLGQLTRAAVVWRSDTACDIRTDARCRGNRVDVLETLNID